MNPRTALRSAPLLVLAACGAVDDPSNMDPPHATIAQAQILPELGETSRGAVFHGGNCTSANSAQNLTVFLPGTNAVPGQSQIFVKEVGDATGMCVVAVPYVNRFTVNSCCASGPSEDTVQIASCYESAIGTKVASQPPSTPCVFGDVPELAVGGAESVLGEVGSVLVELGMADFVSGGADDPVIAWSNIYLTGHSQGSVMAHYIGMKLHELAGIGSIGGGVMPTLPDPPGFADFVCQPPLTPSVRWRAFHHEDDDKNGRRTQGHLDLGYSPAHVLTTNAPCIARPHSCVVIDNALPKKGDQGTPVPFTTEWVWLVSPPEPTAVGGVAACADVGSGGAAGSGVGGGGVAGVAGAPVGAGGGSGAPVAGAAGLAGSGGSTTGGPSTSGSSDDGGCGCRAASPGPNNVLTWGVAALVVVSAWRRRRARPVPLEGRATRLRTVGRLDAGDP